MLGQEWDLAEPWFNWIFFNWILWSDVCYPSDFDLKSRESRETFKTIESNCEEGLLEILKKIRKDHVNKILIGNININSIRN